MLRSPEFRGYVSLRWLKGSWLVQMDVSGPNSVEERDAQWFAPTRITRRTRHFDVLTAQQLSQQLKVTYRDEGQRCQESELRANAVRAIEPRKTIAGRCRSRTSHGVALLCPVSSRLG